MTTKQLEHHVFGFVCVSGEVKYLLSYRNLMFWCKCHDTMAYDRIMEHKSGVLPDRAEAYCYHKDGSNGSYKQALNRLYQAGLQQHGLGEYAYKSWK